MKTADLRYRPDLPHRRLLDLAPIWCILPRPEIDITGTPGGVVALPDVWP